MSPEFLLRLPPSTTWVLILTLPTHPWPPYLKALQPGTLTVLLTILNTVMNGIYHSRSRRFSRAQLPLLPELTLALVPHLLLVILAFILLLLLVPGSSTLTNCTWRFYHNRSFISCAWWFYPDQLHLAVLPQPIAPCGSTPTNCLLLMLGGSTPTNFTC